jgi:WD40 repeat protein
MALDHEVAPEPSCVASTSTENIGLPIEVGNDSYDASAPFSQARFTSDGTTVVTQRADHSFATFVLPAELLDDSARPHLLKPTCTTPSASAIQSYAVYPGFNLAEPSTAVFLSAATDLPITLINALDGRAMDAKYPLIDPMTEAYIAANSLAWSHDGLRFVAGSRSQLSIFDAHRYNEGPVVTHKTANNKKNKRVYGDHPGCRGLIMALDISPDGMLAAGTTEGQIALYDGVDNTECWTSFRLPAKSGITQLAWSPDGQYLLAAERQSDGIHVYDIRNALRRLSFLEGRVAKTHQRMGMSVVPTADGYEAWAGGADGCVRMWKNPGLIEDRQSPDFEHKMHDSPVSSAVWHPHGAVLATCSGEPPRSMIDSSTDDSSDDESTVEDGSIRKAADNTLKIWTV